MASSLPLIQLDPITPAPAAPPLPTIQLDPVETGFFEGLGNSAMRGATSLDSGIAAGQYEAGLIDAPTFADIILRNQADMQRYPSSPGAQAGRDALQKIPSVFSWETGGALLQHPAVIPDLIAESVPASLPSILGGAVGGIGGGLAGGPVGATAGVMAGTAAGSAATEYGSSIVGGLTDAGIPVTKDTILAILSDPVAMSALRTKSLTRGIVVGAVDGFSAGVAGRFYKPVELLTKKVGGGVVAQPLAGGLAETGVQAGLGMTGEAGAQIATEGKIVDRGAIAAEGIGEAGSLVTDVAPAVASRMAGEALGAGRGQPVPQGARVEPTFQPASETVQLDPLPEIQLDPVDAPPVAPSQPPEVAQSPGEAPGPALAPTAGSEVVPPTDAVPGAPLAPTVPVGTAPTPEPTVVQQPATPAAAAPALVPEAPPVQATQPVPDPGQQAPVPVGQAAAPVAAPGPVASSPDVTADTPAEPPVVPAPPVAPPEAPPVAAPVVAGQPPEPVPGPSVAPEAPQAPAVAPDEPLRGQLREIAKGYRDAGDEEMAKVMEARANNKTMEVRQSDVDFNRNKMEEKVRALTGNAPAPDEEGGYTLERFFQGDSALEKRFVAARKVAAANPTVAGRMAQVEKAIKDRVKEINAAGFTVQKARQVGVTDARTSLVSLRAMEVPSISGAMSRYLMEEIKIANGHKGADPVKAAKAWRDVEKNMSKDGVPAPPGRAVPLPTAAPAAPTPVETPAPVQDTPKARPKKATVDPKISIAAHSAARQAGVRGDAMFSGFTAAFAHAAQGGTRDTFVPTTGAPKGFKAGEEWLAAQKRAEAGTSTKKDVDDAMDAAEAALARHMHEEGRKTLGKDWTKGGDIEFNFGFLSPAREAMTLKGEKATKGAEAAKAFLATPEGATAAALVEDAQRRREAYDAANSKPVETPAPVPAPSQDRGPTLADLKPHLPKDAQGATDYSAIPLLASEYLGESLQWKDMTPAQRQEFMDRLIEDNADINAAPTKAENRDTPTFTEAARERGDPVSELAFIEAGLDPDEAQTMTPKAQAEVLSNLLTDTFGFKAVNWDNANVRDAIDNMLNAYRNLRMMLFSLGLPVDALGLKNTVTLTLARGTRLVNGRKRTVNYLGAYDSEKKDIEIVDRANTFAHEWAHALDNFLMEAIYQGPGMNDFLSLFTRKEGIDVLAGDVPTAFARVMNALFFDQAALAVKIADLQRTASRVNPKTGLPTKAAIEAEEQLMRIENGSARQFKIRSDFYKDAKAFQPGNPYWLAPWEMFARAFEAYVAHRAALVDGTNEFVSYGNDAYENTTDRRLRMTFPKAADRAAIFAALDDLFLAIAREGTVGSLSVATAPDMSVVFDPNKYIVARAIEGSSHRRLYARMRDELSGILAALRQIAQGNFRETLAEFRDSVSERAGLGNPRSSRISALAQGARVTRSILSTEAGMLMLRVKANMGRSGQFLDAIRKQIAREPGRGDLQGDLYLRAVMSQTNRAMGQISAAMEAHGIAQFAIKTARGIKGKEAWAARQRIRQLLTNAGAKVNALPDEIAVAAAVRRVLDSVYRRAKAAGLNVGYVSDQGYLPRMVNEGAVFDNPRGFEIAAAKAYSDQYDEFVDGAKDPMAEVAATLKELRRKEVRAASTPEIRDAERELEAELAKNPQDKAAIDKAAKVLRDLVQPVYANTKAKEYKEAILLGDPYTFSHGLGPTSSHTAKRTLPPSADVHLADFYVDDPFAAAHAYIYAMNRKIEYQTRFGQVGGETWQRDYDEYVQRNRGVEEERRARGLSKLEAIQTLTDPAVANRLEMLLTEAMRAGAHPEDIAGMRGHVERITGLGENGVTTEDNTASTLIYSAGNLALLGRIFFTALAEPAASFGRGHDIITNALTGFKTLSTYISLPLARKDSAELQALAEVYGIVNNAYNEQATQALMDFQQPGLSWSRLMASFMERNLQTPLTNAQRKAALAGFHWFINRTLKEALGPAGVDRDRARAELRELGFAANDLQPMADWLASLNGGRPVPGQDTDTPYGQAYGVAAREFVFSTIQEPDKSTKPRLMGYRWGRLVFGLLSFAYTLARNTHLRFKNRVTRDIQIYRDNGHSSASAYSRAFFRNGAVYAGGFGAIFVAQLMTTLLRESLLNADEWERRKQEGGLEAWLWGLAFSRTGVLGPLDPLYQAATALKYNRDLTGLFAGPYMGSPLGVAQSALNLLINNSDRTNNAEYAFWKDSYRLGGNLLIALATSAMPGGPIVSGISTIGLVAGSSPGASDKFARAIVGPKDATEQRRAREAKRANETPLERMQRERREERKRQRQQQED